MASQRTSCGERWAGPPDFSPSGRWVAVYQRPALGSSACNRAALWLIRTRDGARRLLTGKLDWWSWSPAADRIAFSTGATESSAARLFVAAPMGGRRFVFAAKGLLYYWSPNGRWLGFSAGGRLSIVRGDGSHRRVVARESRIFRWSPDSEKILYLGPHGPNDNGAIFVVDRSGKHRHQVVSGYGANWSADGRWVSYYANSDTSWRDIHVVHPDGSANRTLGSGCIGGQWSPRADALLISYARCGVAVGDFATWVVDAETGTTLLQDRGEPLWSPDGHRLAIARGYTEPHLTLVESDGTNRVDVPGVTAGEAAWSPTGARLAFVTRDGQISVINSMGLGLRQAAEGSWPVWSPSGQRLAYQRFREGCGDEIWILRLRTQVSRRLLSCR